MSILLEKRILLEDAEINYWESEIKSSKVVLFVHGWGMQASAYRSALKRLGSNFRVVALDLPGFGKSRSLSSSSKKYTSFDYANCISSFSQKLDINEFYLVGHSMGGGVSALVAALFPEKVLKLILIDCAGKPLGDLRRVLAARLVEIPLQTIGNPLSKENVHMGHAFLNNLLKNGSHTLNTLKIPLNENLMSYFKTINVPCLILWGKKDKTIPIDCGRDIAALVPNSELIEIEDGYHEWSILMPDEFSKLITNFIRLQ